MEAFVYVIHYNSFHKAADALFLSQPSVSARIQSLERELGAKLFQREGRHFSLTEKGKQFLPYARQILQSYKKGKQQLRQMNAVPDELRLGCTVSASTYILPELLPAFRRKYREVPVKLETASSEAILEKLLAKEIDVGLVRSISHPDIDAVRLYEDPIRLFVYAGHPFASRSGVTVEEVGRQPLVFFECGSLDWMKIHRLFEALDHPPSIAMHIDNLETAKKLVLRGTGISFLPELCAREEMREGRLIPIDIPSLSGLSLGTEVVTRKGEGTGLRDRFMELCLELDLKAYPTEMAARA
ncbi:LysR family transcriptional regulator [Paenibacillus filicis]|uniref:LysR family transcriptional regulator n=2 Tax=Paenibacillus filicis TaxID=669464 RepID=A0ABU9DLY7_9BACL